MANVDSFLPVLSELEGGLSNAKTDYAAVNCSSGCTGGTKENPHTNRGVTWCTHVRHAKEKNIPQSQWCSLFIQMPDYWLRDIFKSRFWDLVKGDQLKSQAIAEYWANATWGNPSTANRFLKEALNNIGIKVNTLESGKLADIVNDVIDNMPDKEFNIFASMVEARVAWLHTLGGAKNNPGWFTRQEKLYKRGKALIKSKSNPVQNVKYRGLGVLDRDYRTFMPSSTVKKIFTPEVLLTIGAGLFTGYVISRVIKK